MAHISISVLASFVNDEPKSLSRGENHYVSGHVESFSYSAGVVRGPVKAYKVVVSIPFIELE